MKHYGTIRVPGVASVCYKIGLNLQPPKGYRTVGSGASYRYVTNDRRNPAHDVVATIAWRKTGSADWWYGVPAGAEADQEAKMRGWMLGRTRAEFNRVFNERGATWSTRKDADEVLLVTAVGFDCKATFMRP